MNILVTGADGQLGSAMRKAARNGADSYLFAGKHELDITDAAAVRKTVAENHIGAIVNCAAYTDVDGAEDDPDRARLLNATAVDCLTGTMRENGGLLVHISTDYVFGGTPQSAPFTEEQTPCPTGVYGRTKREGEEAVLRSGCRHLILRTSWLYGETGRNFVRTMLGLVSSRSQVRVVFDQTGTPTYAGNLAETIVRILGNRSYAGREGIYHFSDEGVCSRYDFAVAIAGLSGHADCDIRPCRSGEFPARAVRPAYSVLDKTKIKRTFGLSLPHWRDSLQRCLANIRQA